MLDSREARAAISWFVATRQQRVLALIMFGKCADLEFAAYVHFAIAVADYVNQQLAFHVWAYAPNAASFVDRFNPDRIAFFIHTGSLSPAKRGPASRAIAARLAWRVLGVMVHIGMRWHAG